MPEASLASLLDLSGQVALITGASRGIGWAIAELFAQAGARVAMLARAPEPLGHAADALREQHGAAKILALPADVAIEAQVSAAVQQVADAWGRLDILVNNAGLIHFGPIDQISLAEWQQVLGANLTGAYLCSRAVAPLMRQQSHGRIVNVASISGQTGGVSGGADYAASKGGLIAFTKTLARDLAPHGVTVNAIAPGQIDADPNLLSAEAPQRHHADHALARLGEPREVAYAALFLASPMASYITGATLDVNGGILKR
jgi:NAD(P)-dependent dehydrogenase (short-subunit alcohol dehydrogenase family)